MSMENIELVLTEICIFTRSLAYKLLVERNGVLQSWQFKPQGSGSWQSVGVTRFCCGLSSGLQAVVFLLCPHVVEKT